MTYDEERRTFYLLMESSLEPFPVNKKIKINKKDENFEIIANNL